MLTNIARATSDRIEYAIQPARQCLRLFAVLAAASVLFLLSDGAYSAQGKAAQSDKASPATKARTETNYPDRPIRLLVPLAIGGAVDTMARLIGTYLTKSVGQQFVVDNRPGAGSIIGTEIVAKATPDGYTILMHSSTFAVMPSIFKELPFDPAKNFVPITSVSSVPFVLVVNMSTFKSVDDLVTAARSKPGQLNFGSAGIGSPTHLTSELLAAMAGVTFMHVPFKGAPQALTDVIAGRLDFMFVSAPLAKSQIEAGRIKGLAVSTSIRAAALPNLPTVDEAGLKGYDVTVWSGLFAPSGTRHDVITKLSDHVIRVLNDPEVKKKFAASGTETMIMTQTAFSKYFQSELVKWRQVVKRSGATAQ
jgi:tripartite-type tricarboxylate transporter receptor subunit TctC